MSQEGQVVSLETNDGKIHFYFIRSPEDLHLTGVSSQLVDSSDPIPSNFSAGNAENGVSLPADNGCGRGGNSIKRVNVYQGPNMLGSVLGVDQSPTIDGEDCSRFSVFLSEHMVHHETAPAKQKKHAERDISVSVSFTHNKVHHRYTLKGKGLVYDNTKSESVNKANNLSDFMDKPCFLKLGDLVLSVDSDNVGHKCNECGRLFKYKRHLKSHGRVHAAVKPYNCDVCNKGFTHCGNLTTHRKMKHPTAEKLACSTCDKQFSSTNHLKEHTQSHTDEMGVECNICSKQFISQRSMLQHRQLHIKPKSHLCKVCNKAFSVASYLKRHMLVHSRVTPFKCGQCSMAFRYSSSLSQHVSVVHVGHLPFKCHICDRPFSRKYNLELHMRKHTGERPYKCKFCPKTFIGGTDRVRHERIHTGERPYKCDLCDRAFIQNTSLKAHRKSHEDDGSFEKNSDSNEVVIDGAKLQIMQLVDVLSSQPTD